MKNEINIKAILIQIFATKIGWLVITILMALIFGIIGNTYDLLWANVLMYASLVYPAIFLIVSLVFAWIINPWVDRHL